MTNRIQSEIRSSIGLLNSIFSDAEFGLALLDDDLNYVHLNACYQDLVFTEGITPEIGANIVELGLEALESGAFVLPDGISAQAMQQGMTEAILTVGLKVEIERTDGRYLEAESKKVDLGGYLITVRDISDRKRLEAAEKTKWDALNDVIGSLEEGFSLWGPDMRFIMSNDRYMELAMPHLNAPITPGTSAEEVVRDLYQANAMVLPDEMTEKEFIANIVEWVNDFETPRDFQYANGRTIMSSTHRTGLGGYLLTVLDVTGERESDRKARDMLLDAFQALDEGLVLCDENMNFIFGNNAWKKMLFEGFEENIPKPGESVVENLFKQINAGYYAIPQGMSNEDYAAWMMGEMSQHGKQVPYSSADGRHFVGSSHLTQFGGALMFVRDVTLQITATEELEQQREATHQNEKLSALGELLAGVAHELNNPLSVIFGYSQMLQGKVADPVAAERIDLICQSAERSAKIVRTFLAMARQRPTESEPCPVNDVVATALEVSTYSLKTNGARVRVDLDPSDPHVNGDFDQLAQVFSNLLINAGHAIQAKGEEGEIVIRSRLEAGGAKVVIEISDNGHGIPHDIQPRIFEPFFTTKDVGEGTGIGLAFSHRIVESHSGVLSLRSDPGKGATFTTTLKTIDGRADTASAHANPPSGHRSILVVDDEDGVAQLIADLLTEEGHRVTKTTDPRKALRLAEAEQFDAVLSDFRMPGMNGETFFRAMKAIAPENARRLGFVTGDAMGLEVRKFLSTSHRPYIEKPIIKDELLTLIDRNIEEGR